MGNEVIAVDPNPENQALLYNSLGNVPYFYIFLQLFHKKYNRSIHFDKQSLINQILWYLT